MRRVARRAGYSVGSVSGILEPGVLLLACMTTQTPLCHHLRSRFLEIEDFCLVTAPVDMLRAGTVAGFTAMCLHAALIFQEIVPVTSLLNTLEDVFVAGFAGVSAHVFRRRRALSRLVGLVFRRCLRTAERHDYECGNGCCHCKPPRCSREFHSLAPQ